ncbi:MAG: hypothetical protein J6386_14050 [Candidatus Synoicihabitans palmerolidicus]|nr:hypothetical protein [Candidatus Synoicihabitans palmerolidicus]
MNTAFAFPISASTATPIVDSQEPGRQLRTARVGTLARYDSGWVEASNRRSCNIAFPHQLGVLPTQVMAVFSPDCETVFPLPPAWNAGGGVNLASVWMTAESLTMAIVSGFPLHGKWGGEEEQWTHWSKRWFRVWANP